MGAVIAGYLTSKIDPRKMIAFGFAVFVGGSLWHGLLTLDILPSSLEFRSQFRSFRSAPCSRSRQRGVLAEGSLRTFDGAILITAILALLTPLDPIICRSTTIGPPGSIKKLKMSIARMITGEGRIQTRSSIFSATRFGRGDRRIARVSARRRWLRVKKRGATP